MSFCKMFFTHYCDCINQGHENGNWNLFRMRPGVCKLSVDLISAKSKGVMFDGCPKSGGHQYSC